jgi:hypothetical protein
VYSKSFKPFKRFTALCHYYPKVKTLGELKNKVVRKTTPITSSPASNATPKPGWITSAQGTTMQG